MVNYFEKGLRGTVVVSIFTILAYLSGYLTRLFLARTITTEEFGLFYSVFTLFMFVCVFTDLGYSTALVKFIPEFLVKKKKELVLKTIFYVFIITFFLSIIAGVLLFLARGLLSSYYFKTPAAMPLLFVFVFILALNAVAALFSSVFQAYQNMFRYGLFYFLIKFIFLLSCIILFYSGLKGSLMPGLAYMVSLVILILLFVYPFYKNIKPVKLSKGFDKAFFLKISKFALPNLLTALAGTIIGYIDTMILTYMVSLDKVGVYNAVLPTVLILSYLGGVLATVFFPMVSELWVRKEHDRLRSGLALISRYALIIVLPLSFSMLFFSKTILRVFFGENFVSGAPALSILSVGVIFLSLAQVNFSVLNGVGKPKEITKITVVAALFNIVFNIILIPVMGIAGSALTTTLSYLIMFVWSYVLIRKCFSFKFEKLIAIAVSSAAFLVSLYVLKNILSMNVYVESVVCLVVSGLVYVAAIFLFRLVSVSDLQSLLKRKL
jgi:O-antigen/teichoic acid export membrane protein